MNTYQKRDLREISLTQAWKHFTSDEVVVMLTAFKRELPPVESQDLNYWIARNLRVEGFGYFYANGFFRDTCKHENNVDVQEDCVFAIGGKTDEVKLVRLAHDLANKHELDAILVKESDGTVYFLKADGLRNRVDEKMSPSTIGKLYSQLRNQKSTDANSFVFEGAGTDPNNIGKFMRSIREK